MPNEDVLKRMHEYLMEVGPAHPYQISKALGYDREIIRSALEELEKQGKILYRIPSYYALGKPVIPFQE